MPPRTGPVTTLPAFVNIQHPRRSNVGGLWHSAPQIADWQRTSWRLPAFPQQSGFLHAVAPDEVRFRPARVPLPPHPDLEILRLVRLAARPRRGPARVVRAAGHVGQHEIEGRVFLLDGAALAIL